MATVFCDNCGTSLLDSAKFCRACGKPTPALSEATTKKFDEQTDFQNPTRSVGPSFTGPAYMSPMEFNPAAPGAATNDLRQKTRNRNLMIIACMFGVMILALAGLLIFLNFGINAPPTPPTTAVEIPAIPPPPPVPGQPTPPPITVTPAETGIDPSLIYPGSRQTMSIVKPGGKSVLQLVSSDAAKTVADWYSSRLQGAKKVSILGIGPTILKLGDVGVVITGSDEGTQILITKGGGGD